MVTVALLSEASDSVTMGAPKDGQATRPAWKLGDLKRPLALVVAAAAMLTSGAITIYASCSVHEISHALVGTAMGWEVDRVSLCPGDAEVIYTHTTDTWYGRAEGFAGGFGAAVFIVAVYWLVFVRRDRPLRGPGWWAAGLGVLAGTGAQLVIGGVEGIAGVRGWDYTEMLDENRVVWLPVVGAMMLAFAGVHVWRWREVWRSPRSHEDPSDGTG